MVATEGAVAFRPLNSRAKDLEAFRPGPSPANRAKDCSCPILAAPLFLRLGWDRTNPISSASLQGLTGRSGIHPRLPKPPHSPHTNRRAARTSGGAKRGVEGTGIVKMTARPEVKDAPPRGQTTTS